MIIDVTQEDIDLGKPGMCNCPIARAIKRTVKRHTGVKVFAYSIRIGDDKYPSPIEIVRFMRAFKSGRFVEPQKFEVNWDKIK